MKTKYRLICSLVTVTLACSVRAADVAVPDPGLNAAIRDALQKPDGALTAEDMLSLTNLDARNRNVGALDGLETALNLRWLDVQLNHITNLSLLGTLTNLSTVNASGNPLTNVVVTGGLSNLTSLTLENDELTSVLLSTSLLGLTNLDLENNHLIALDELSNLTSLASLDLGFNAFTNFSMPLLPRLTSFYFAGNPLTSLDLPTGLSAMSELNLSQNQLGTVTIPKGMTNLAELDLAFNQLTNVVLPPDLTSLKELDLDFNRLSNVDFANSVTTVRLLHLRANRFTDFSLPLGLTSLTYLDVTENPVTNILLPVDLHQLSTLRISRNTNLTRLTLPVGLTNLVDLNITENSLTNLVLPPDLNRLQVFNAGGNQLIALGLSSGLTNLTALYLTGNQLTGLTLPADMVQVTNFGYLGNPLTTLVLPEQTAANLGADIAVLKNQGVTVSSYPLSVQVLRPRPLTGAFQLGLAGPPGLYNVIGSTDLMSWAEVGLASNTVGAVSFVDTNAQRFPNRFYRAALQAPPKGMVFVPPSTFVMGSSSDDPDHSADEVPQTTVTLTRGFWIGKYEVTEGDYLSVMGTNPSSFPGDLSRPISGVTWFDATNYCWNLTLSELAAGRIPSGSQFRLPTEAEWECAARGGTTTRFSYGDDSNYSSLTNYAWFLDLAKPDLTVHPVGQKLPNSWGLYDVHGSMWEWCQDWYGEFPGGVQVDPTGPVSNPNGSKVMRGGAYDYPNTSCRSASRLFRNAFLTDSDVGFRVVLVKAQ